MEREPTDRWDAAAATKRGERLGRILDRRADALTRLRDGPLTKSSLAEALDVSQSTVDRAVRRLETAGLARRDGSRVAATLAGRLASESFRRYSEEAVDVARFADLLRHLPATAAVGRALLDGATVYRSEPPATARPSDEVLELFRNATRVRGCAKVVNDSAAAEAFFRMVTERGGAGTFVYTTSLADHFREEYGRMTLELVSTGRYRAYETEELPYELFVVEGVGWTTVAVLVYDETETLRGALVNDTDAAVAWAEATLERYREAATEFTDDLRTGRSDAGTMSEE